MEVYFLKKLILHRSDIRGRNESQNIKGCSGVKLQEPLLIPPLAPPKPISFYPNPFLLAQDQFQPIMAHFPPPFSWPKPKPNAVTHFLFFFSFLSFPFHFFPPLAHHFPLSSPMLLASSYSHPTSCNQPPSASSPITFPFFLPCKLPSPHLPITFLFFLSLFHA